MSILTLVTNKGSIIPLVAKIGSTMSLITRKGQSYYWLQKKGQPCLWPYFMKGLALHQSQNLNIKRCVTSGGIRALASTRDFLYDDFHPCLRVYNVHIVQWMV